MKRLAIASHVALISDKEYDGIGNVLIETLKGVDTSFTMVRHSMEGKLSSVVRLYEKGTITHEKRLPVVSGIAPLRYATEILTTMYHFMFRQKIDVFIGIDPLNAFVGVVLKKLKRIDTCVFYTPDYSPRRFDSNLLNSIYHWIDRYCVRHADEVWSVSTRICSIRKQMNLKDEKNIFIPNVPPVEYAALKSAQHERQTLIMYGVVDKQLDYEGAIRTVEKLRHQFADMRLIIVGNGPEENNLKALAAKLEIADRVTFAGNQPLGKTLEYASRAGIGLALYTGIWGFNKYGDSTKCREYFYFGLPVISTDTHSTVEDIRKTRAGLIVEKDVADYSKAIEDILQNYDEYSSASYKLGEKYDGTHRVQLLRVLL